MTHPEGFHHATQITVRFADLDALGHLNHAKYLTYAEHARIVYIAEVCGWNSQAGDGWKHFGIILARAECDYKLPVAFGDRVTVWTRISRLGGKSFDFEYVLMRHREGEADAICATAKTVMVAYDYIAETTIAIPDEWRQRIQTYEGL